jgi:membrane fusion protein (multidrug efflux system)
MHFVASRQKTFKPQNQGHRVKSVSLIIVVVAIAIGGFWYMNQNGESAGGGRPRGFGPVLVVAETVQRKPLITSIEALGTAKANESVTITASLTDTVRRVNFDDGDFVEAGTVLVELTNKEEEAQLAEARANLEEAERQLRRLEDLDRQGIAATSEVDGARSAASAAEARLNTVLARLQDRLIRAPFSGVLGFRDLSAGALLMPGEAITTLDDISSIKLDFTVPEVALSQMERGRKVIATSAGTGATEFEGTVRTVGSRVDPVTRAIVVRAMIDNTDQRLRPGMLLTVRIVTDERDALMIPERAVVQNGANSMVYVVVDGKRAVPRPVKMGVRQTGVVEIAEGLTEGELIVTEGVIKMRPGIEIRLAGDDDDAQVAGGGGGRPGTEKSGGGRPPAGKAGGGRPGGDKTEQRPGEG